MNPISALVAWRKSNPAPANSTGWYLPSAKELHMLCYKDVDNIRAGGNGYTNTKEVVNASLVKFNGSTFGDEIYASSTEYYKDYGYYHVFTVTFKNASVYHNPKYNDFFVRAVCAF
ncbi:MAG: hypothetical protein IJN66_09620 [Muribaculaceae bacterium]|nr:hypothetical protein [Muribaculaceae bacterium]